MTIAGCSIVCFVLLALFCTTKTQASTCIFSDSYLAEGTCYRYNATNVTWNDAKAGCASWGGALASFNTPTQIVSAMLNTNMTLYSVFWFGANDIDVEGTWIWDHNKQPATMMFLYGLWYAGNPSNNCTCWDCGLFYAVSPPAALSQLCTILAGYLCMELPLPTTTTIISTTTTPTTTAVTTTSTPSTTTTEPTTTTTPTTITTSTTTTTTSTSTTTPTPTTTTSTSTTTPTTTTTTTSTSTTTPPTTTTTTATSTTTTPTTTITTSTSTTTTPTTTTTTPTSTTITPTTTTTTPNPTTTTSTTSTSSPSTTTTTEESTTTAATSLPTTTFEPTTSLPSDEPATTTTEIPPFEDTTPGPPFGHSDDQQNVVWPFLSGGSETINANLALYSITALICLIPHLLYLI